MEIPDGYGALVMFPKGQKLCTGSIGECSMGSDRKA